MFIVEDPTVTVETRKNNTVKVGVIHQSNNQSGSNKGIVPFLSFVSN